MLRQIFNEPSFAFSSEPLNIYLPSSSSTSVSSLLKMLSTGKFATSQRSEIEEMKKTANILGINLKNCQIDCKTLNKKKHSQKANNKIKSPSTVKKFLNTTNTSLELKVEETDQVDRRCEVCNAEFSTSSNLYKHRRNKHGLMERIVVENKDFNKPPKCDECGSVFKARRHLVRHRMNQHGLETKRKKREFTNIPDSEKPFKCDFCIKTFIQKSQLKTHQQKYHKENLADQMTLNRSDTEDQVDIDNTVSETVLDDDADIRDIFDDNVEVSTSVDGFCKFCGEMFSNDDDLHDHISNVHNV